MSHPTRPAMHAPALLLVALATLAGCATQAPVVQPAALASPLATPAPARSPAATALHALFDASWDASMQRYPEWATYIGDNRWGDRLYDASPENEAAGYADLRQRLAAAQAVDRGALSAKDRISGPALGDGIGQLKIIGCATAPAPRWAIVSTSAASAWPCSTRAPCR